MEDVKVQIRSFLHKGEIDFYRAPGRINLIGEHTDYNGGLVLPGAIDRYMYFGFAMNNSGRITFHAMDLKESVSIPLGGYNKVEEEWANYLIGNLNVLSSKGYVFTGFECAFTSDIPVGAGMSSSSALECAFLVGVNDVFNLHLSNWDIVHNSHQSNHKFMGVRGGILDQFASIFSSPDELLMLNCDSHEFKKIDADFGDYSLLLINTNVKHNHVSSGYNDRVAECQSALNSIRQQNPDVSTLSDIWNIEDLDNIDFESTTVKNRAVFIANENRRVIELALALELGDYQRCGELLYQGHEGLSMRYEVSCPELDFLVQLLKDAPHVLGSRMMGGGFGGCTINLIHKNKVDAVRNHALIMYEQKFDIKPDFYQVRLSGGAGSF